KADDRHRLLLRAEGACRRDRAAQQENQLAASHSITSSARAVERIQAHDRYHRRIARPVQPRGDTSAWGWWFRFTPSTKLPNLHRILETYGIPVLAGQAALAFSLLQ